jgi:hypothetical protein
MALPGAVSAPLRSISPLKKCRSSSSVVSGGMPAQRAARWISGRPPGAPCAAGGAVPSSAAEVGQAVLRGRASAAGPPPMYSLRALRTAEGFICCTRELTLPSQCRKWSSFFCSIRMVASFCRSWSHSWPTSSACAMAGSLRRREEAAGWLARGVGWWAGSTPRCLDGAARRGACRRAAVARRERGWVTLPLHWPLHRAGHSLETSRAAGVVALSRARARAAARPLCRSRAASWHAACEGLAVAV